MYSTYVHTYIHTFLRKIHRYITHTHIHIYMKHLVFSFEGLPWVGPAAKLCQGEADEEELESPAADPGSWVLRRFRPLGTYCRGLKSYQCYSGPMQVGKLMVPCS